MLKPDFMILANDLACRNVSDLTRLLGKISEFGEAYF